MNSCLFIVDVQNGFVNHGVTDFAVTRIKELLEKNLFNMVIFTKFINKTNSPYRDFLNWNKLSTSDEQEIVSELKPYAEIVIEKTVYTAINDETLKLIKDNNIDSAYVLGIDTDCCVLNTAVDLFENHIHPYVLEYYSASNGGNDSHKAALKCLERLIGRNNILYGPIAELIN